MTARRGAWGELLWGVGFGLIIARAGATRFDVLRDMFLLRSFQLYGVIGGAIAVALPAFWLLERRAHARGAGAPPPALRGLRWPHRRWNPGTLPGALIFGVGWALTGSCPGPIAVQIGQGHVWALATAAGVLVGTLAYEAAHKRWFTWRPDTCA